jgi:hypothetical protein
MAIAQRRIPGPAAGWPRGIYGCRPRITSRTLLGLMALLVLGAGPAAAIENLNTSLEEICQPLLELNTKLGASAAPGSPAGGLMQTELSLSAAQYGALWSLLKLTPTPGCSRLY